MVDLLIDSGASLRQNNEGAIFSLKQYPISFIPLVSGALWFLFPAHIKIYSQGQKKNLMPPLYANE